MNIEPIKRNANELAKNYCYTNKSQYKASLLDIIYNKILKDDNIDNAERLEILFEILLTISDVLELREYMRENYTNIIDYPKLFNKYHKKSVAAEYVLQRITALEKVHPTERRLFLRDIASAIKNYDYGLSNGIRNIIITDETLEERHKLEAKVLQEIIKIIAENEQRRTPEKIAKDIKTKIPHIESMFRSFGDKKTLKKIKEYLLILSGEEVEYLQKYLNDLKQWPNYVTLEGKDIKWFVARLKEYLEGDKIDPNSGFKGIQSYFKDHKLVKEMHENDHIKQLLNFIEELKFFEWAKNTVVYAYNNPRWAGWLGKDGLYYNLHKGKNYIKTVEEKYGNHHLALVLRQTIEKIHQSPVDWATQFDKIEKGLEDKHYQYSEVLEKAQKPLLFLFDKRKIELQQGEFKSVEQLKNLLSERIKEMKKETDVFVKKIKKLITKRKEEIDKEYTLKRVELERMLFEDKYVEKTSKFNEETYNWFKKVKEKRTKYKEEGLKENTKRKQLKTSAEGLFARAVRSGESNNYVKEGWYAYATLPYIYHLGESIIACEDYEAKLLFFEQDDTENCLKLIQKGLDIATRANKVAAKIYNHRNDFIVNISKPDVVKIKSKSESIITH